MSWAAEDWTSGLSGLVLKKVQELQVHNEKLNRERQQRQLQLDNSEAALHKQKQKYEEVRGELGAVQRELVGVREQALGEARARDRLTQELQAKAAQVCTLESHLDSTRTLVQNLTQEVKRLEAELEKLQKESVSGDSMLFSTPCWNMNSPWDQSGKSSVRGEDISKVRQQLLFGDGTRPSASGVSSPFPQQPHRSPPLRHKINQSESRPISSVFPWERDDTRSTPRGRAASTHTSSSFTCSDVITDTGARDDGLEEALRKEIDGLRVRASGLQLELQLEKDRCRESESRFAQAQKELNLNEQNLTRSRDELARAQTRIAQEGDRTQAAEQRVKQLQEELKCQRQNAETSRCNAEQRRKEMEREHQRELLELQRERQSMEKQHQQETSRLNQELQQARTQHNTLQSQYDKLALQKLAVERDLEGVQGKLKSTQSDLIESQKQEALTQAKLTESLKENEGLSVSQEQLKKREKSLEAEVKRLTEELAEALKFIKELQAQLAAPPPQVASCPVAGDSFSSVPSTYRSYSPPHQHSSQRKKTLKTQKPKISDRSGNLTYPPEREPGEGIDSEHMSEFGSEDSPTVSISVQERKRSGAERSSEAEMESSITEQDTGIEDIDTDSCMSDSISEHMFKDDLRCDSGSQKSSSSNQGQKRDSSSIVELKKENLSLRDELRDIKRELDQRLDDLESQRRAETEARTKLKQLSKKHSSQAEQHRIKALELKDKGSKLETQLEQERKESARLREVVTTLDQEAEKRKEEGEREEEETKEEIIKLKEALAQMERKEEHLEKDREKMHKELELLQSELLQVREEREREREEEKILRSTYEVEGLKIAELQAELDRLQSSTKVENKNVNTNMPLTYLQLGNQPNTTNDVTALENDVTSSLSTNIFFYESANLQNTLFSKEPNTALISECGIGFETGEQSPVEQDTTSTGNLEDHTKSTEGMNLDDTTVLVLEVERMQVQRDREAERAKKSQKKLEALQNQVTSQTQQLTLAFENQSKHIEGLLRELQQRDGALQRQAEELQSCQKELASLKADKQMTEMVSMTSSTEKSVEVLAELSCGLVISTGTSNTHEVAEQEFLHAVKNEPLQSDQQSITNLEVVEDEPGNASAASDKTNTSHVTLAPKEHVTLTSSDVHGKDSVHYTENTTAEEVPELLTTAQKDYGPVIEINTENAQSSVESSLTETKELPEYLQKLLEHSTDSTSALKMVINKLHAAQDELSELKARHDQLTLQLQEVSRQDFLSLKQEHEQLKLKLIDNEMCLSEINLNQDESNHLTNMEEKSVSVTNLKEKIGIGGRFKDSWPKCGDENEQSENETVQVHSLHEQLQALQSELQLLSEKNKDQAEELQLWRLSAMTSEETLDQESNSSPIVVMREEQLVLSCSSTVLHSHTKQSSSLVQHGGLSHPIPYFEPDHQRENQTSSEKSTEDLPSILKATELIADDKSSISDVNDHQKVEIKTMNGKSASPDLSSEMENSDHRHDLAHQIKQTGLSEDQQPGNPPCEIAFQPESTEDDLAQNGTKTNDPKLNTESAGRNDSYMFSLGHDEVVTATQSGKSHKNTTKQENEHCPAPDSRTFNSVLREDNAEDQQQISAATGVTSSINGAGTKEVKSVCTQTEECNREEVEDIGSPHQRPVVLHASTQTRGEQTVQNEEKEEQIKRTESPPLSLAPASETDRLLFSGSFPIPANPAHLAERIRRNRSLMSSAYDDTEYEPYGLPEVVMKGFADIPSGPACPYVLRRGLLGTNTLPISLRESPVTEPEEEIDP